MMDVNASKNYAMREVPKQEEVLIKEIFTFNKSRLIIFALLIIAIGIGIVFLNITPFALLISIIAFVNLYFGKSYKYIVLLCVTFYSAMFPFQTFAIKFFIDVHGIPREMGGFLSSLLTLSAIFLTPLFGLLSDRIGKRSLLMMVGSLFIIPVYLIMNYVRLGSTNTGELQAVMNLSQSGSGLFGNIAAYFHYFIKMVAVLIVNYPNLFIPMAVMGLSFSLVPAIMWPSVAIIVDESKLGTAYGLMTMIQNIGLFGVNLIIGWANDFSGGYSLGMWMFSSLGFFGLIFAYLLRKSEQGPNGHGLEIGIKKK
jgi:nitrate/nitrite transporter NarK